jgi:uncharacterized protein (DUF305 family)
VLPMSDAAAGARVAGRAHHVALAIAVLFLAVASGYYLGVREAAPPGDGSIDVGFLEDMIAHHEQALQLSNAELLNGVDPTAKTFAGEIVLFQSYEIGLMERQLNEWGYERGAHEVAMRWMGGDGLPVEAMPGLASHAELDALADASGPQADSLFIALMRDHHAGGVHMAAYAAEHARSPFVRDLAARMARNQRIEINEMAAARDRAGLPANPPGFQADAIAPPAVHQGHSQHP